MGSGENGVSRRRAEYPDHVWSYDFAMDTTEDGRRLKVMPVVDEYTRECLSLEGERPIKACGVIETLRRLFIERGEPDYIRSDNGPEFIAGAIKEWLAVCGVKTLYIEPGAPWENAYSETFISRLRDELLERELLVILLVEDYTSFRQALAFMFEREGGQRSGAGWLRGRGLPTTQWDRRSGCRPRST